MARFTSLEIENTMAIKVAEIKPNGEPITTIGGLTAQGKSTVLRSVEMLLDGAKAVPGEPLRRGTKKGFIRGEIDGGPDGGGFSVERKLTRRGTSLVVDGRDGTPQALMDQIKGGCTQDLGKIARMKNAELLAIMRELVPGQDFTDHDAKREEIYKERTGANGDVKRIKAQLAGAAYHDNAPEAEVSVADLAAELARRQEVNAVHDEKRRALRNVGDAYTEARDIVGDAQVTVEKAKVALVTAEANLKSCNSMFDLRAKQGRTLKDEVAKLEDANTEEIQAKLITVDESNRKVRDNQTYAALAVEHKAAEVTARDLSRKLDTLDEKKAKAITEAEYPVRGLSVDDETVMLHGFAWDQASGRERLVASAEIVLAQSPELRELLLDDGSAFDEESKIALGDWADENDAHVWMVVVGDGKGCSIVFHEGEVVGAETAKAEPAESEKAKPPKAKPEIIDVNTDCDGIPI